jgi:hypothetical protein
MVGRHTAFLHAAGQRDRSSEANIAVWRAAIYCACAVRDSLVVGDAKPVLRERCGKSARAPPAECLGRSKRAALALLRILGCTRALIRSATHSSAARHGRAARADAGVKHGVDQLREAALGEAALEQSKTPQCPQGVVLAERDQCAEVAEVEWLAKRDASSREA